MLKDLGGNLMSPDDIIQCREIVQVTRTDKQHFRDLCVFLVSFSFRFRVRD